MKTKLQKFLGSATIASGALSLALIGCGGNGQFFGWNPEALIEAGLLPDGIDVANIDPNTDIIVADQPLPFDSGTAPTTQDPIVNPNPPTTGQVDDPEDPPAGGGQGNTGGGSSGNSGSPGSGSTGNPGSYGNSPLTTPDCSGASVSFATANGNEALIIDPMYASNWSGRATLTVTVNQAGVYATGFTDAVESQWHQMGERVAITITYPDNTTGFPYNPNYLSHYVSEDIDNDPNNQPAPGTVVDTGVFYLPAGTSTVNVYHVCYLYQQGLFTDPNHPMVEHCGNSWNSVHFNPSGACVQLLETGTGS